MAGTATIGIIEKSIFGNKRIHWAYVDITKYPTGGHLCYATDFGLKKISNVTICAVEKAKYNHTIVCSSSGLFTSSGTATTSATSFLIYAGTATQAPYTADIGCVRLEVIGY